MNKYLYLSDKMKTKKNIKHKKKYNVKCVQTDGILYFTNNEGGVIDFIQLNKDVLKIYISNLTKLKTNTKINTLLDKHSFKSFMLPSSDIEILIKWLLKNNKNKKG